MLELLHQPSRVRQTTSNSIPLEELKRPQFSFRSEDSGMNYKDLKARSDKSSTIDDFVLENENPYYVSA